MSLETVPTALPVLALFNEIVFPGSQLTISVSRAFTPQLSRLVKSEDGHRPLVAAVPVVNPEPGLSLKDAKLSEWGCGKPVLVRYIFTLIDAVMIIAARITHFVRPTPLSPNNCIITLAGVTRVQLETPLPVLSEANRLPFHPIQYSIMDPKKGITESAVEVFKTAAVRFVERLDADAKGKERRGKFSGGELRRLRFIIEDAEMEKTPLVAGKSYTILIIIRLTFPS